MNEYNTSKNFSIPRLPHGHAVYPIRHVIHVINETCSRPLYAVVTSLGIFDLLHKLSHLHVINHL
jgi:hypothetical protein